jgi:hypothetical protein
VKQRCPNALNTDLDGIRSYREWLMSVYPSWAKILKGGERKIRQAASFEGMQLPGAIEGLFGYFNGQRTERQYPIPFQHSFGFVLLDISHVASRRNNEMGIRHFIKMIPTAMEYECDPGVRAGSWRKGWYPFAETHTDYGSHVLFADFDPLESAEVGRVNLQTQWLGFGAGWCQRITVSNSLDEFFGNLAQLGRNGHLIYRENFGIDVADRQDQGVCSSLGFNRVRRMPVEAACKS